MRFLERTSLFLLRIVMGWMFFYAGITKVLDSSWTSAGYIKGAKVLPEVYSFFLQPNILPFVDFANKWGLTLLGVSLILGIFIKFSAPLGILLMALYYIPIMNFPHPNAHSYIVDEHIIYAGVLFVLMIFRADRAWGVGR